MHSEEYLSDYRLAWYHQDFLELMGRRWDLGLARSLLDIGCGLCHWNRLLVPLLGKPARITAVDREAGWVDHSRDLEGLYHAAGVEFKVLQASAEALPFPDDSFDIVTCQTLLIHVSDIPAILREAVRVLKPGGRFICSEPNNLIKPLVLNLVEKDTSLQDLQDQTAFEWAYARGKARQGLGESHGVETIPELLRQSGLTGISVYQSDRADLRLLDRDCDLAGEFRETRAAEHEKSKSWCEAAGLSRAGFDRYWKALETLHQEKARRLESASWLECQGSLMYLMSGIKGQRD